MDNITTLSGFITFFYFTFMSPFFRVLNNTEILGFSLFKWVFGFTVIRLAIHFFARFSGLHDVDDDH